MRWVDTFRGERKYQENTKNDAATSASSDNEVVAAALTIANAVYSAYSFSDIDVADKPAGSCWIRLFLSTRGFLLPLVFTTYINFYFIL